MLAAVADLPLGSYRQLSAYQLSFRQAMQLSCMRYLGISFRMIGRGVVVHDHLRLCGLQSCLGGSQVTKVWSTRGRWRVSGLRGFAIDSQCARKLPVIGGKGSIPQEKDLRLLSLRLRDPYCPCIGREWRCRQIYQMEGDGSYVRLRRGRGRMIHDWIGKVSID